MNINEYSPIVLEFIELVQTDSVSKGEREIADVLIQKMNDMGFNVYEDGTGRVINGNAGNIIAVLEGNKDKPAVLFSAHMDRVANGFNINPVVKDGYIRSDGTTILAADDVAGIASILDGIKNVLEMNIDHGKIEVVFTVCEEKGILGSKHLDYDRLESKLAYVMDSVGPVGRIINKGITKNNIKIVVEGKPAHAGNAPEKGINAIIVAAVALASVKDGRINENTTANFGIIKGGEVTNTVCDSVELLAEVRSTSGEDINLYIDHVTSTFKKATEQFAVNFEIHVEESYTAYDISETEYVSKVVERAMSEIDVEYYYSTNGGGTDGNRFCKQGIKTLCLATGYKNNHTLTEEISIDELQRSSELVKNIIVEISNGKGL